MMHENALTPGRSAPPTAAEMAYGTVGLPASTATPAAAPAADAAKPAVRWLTDKKLVESYALAYPFALDGLEVRIVTVKRMSAREVELFIETMRGDASGRPVRWPMYLVDGAPLPDAAWDVMDDDDRFALGEIGADFFARAVPRADGRTSVLIGPGDFRYLRQFVSRIAGFSIAEIGTMAWDTFLDEVVTAMRLREDLEQ